jgi:hypothetical protein
VIVRFDYLGLAKAGSDPGDFGGGVLIAPLLNFNNNTVLAGTFISPGIKLVDDGQWHSYQVSMTLPIEPQHLVLKDLSGVPGDAFFDNLSVTTVPSRQRLHYACSASPVSQYVVNRNRPQNQFSGCEPIHFPSSCKVSTVPWGNGCR